MNGIPWLCLLIVLGMFLIPGIAVIVGLWLARKDCERSSHGTEHKAHDKNRAQNSDRLNTRKAMIVVAQIFGCLAAIAAIMAGLFGAFSHHKEWAIVAAWIGVVCMVNSFFAWYLDAERTRTKTTTPATGAAPMVETRGQRSEIDQERPYILLESVRFLEPPALGKTVKARLIFGNSGKIPAQNVRTISRFVVWSEEPKHAPDVIDRAKNSGSSIAVAVGAKTDVDLVSPIPLGPDDMKGINDGTKKLYILGMTVYEGMSQRAEPYFTSFNFSYEPGNPRAGAAKTGNEIK